MKPEVFHRHAANQVFLDDSFQHILGAGMVPDAVRPDDCDRPGLANLQTIGFGPLHAAAADQSQFLEPLLEVVPSALAGFPSAAFLLFGHRAEEYLSLDRVATDGAKRLFRLVDVRCGHRTCFARGSALGKRKRQPFFPAIQKVLKPYISAGRVKPFAPDAEFGSGLRAISAPGHTPGHSFFRLQDASATMLFWGDTVHMAPVQFPEPDIAIKYDWNVPEAIAARKAILAEAADKGWLVAAAHISFPGIGHVTKLPHGAYQWLPVNYTLNR